FSYDVQHQDAIVSSNNIVIIPENTKENNTCSFSIDKPSSQIEIVNTSRDKEDFKNKFIDHDKSHHLPQESYQIFSKDQQLKFMQSSILSIDNTPANNNNYLGKNILTNSIISHGDKENISIYGNSGN